VESLEFGAAREQGFPDVAPAERKVNVWLEDLEPPIPIEQKVKLGVDIGHSHGPNEQETSVSSEAFREPPWGDRQQLTLLLGLVGPNLTVEPLWREAVLPLQGSMAPVYFDVTAHRAGPVELTLTLRLRKSMALLQEYRVKLEAFDPAKAHGAEEVVA
jgi:hypothetical protein